MDCSKLCRTKFAILQKRTVLHRTKIEEIGLHFSNKTGPGRPNWRPNGPGDQNWLEKVDQLCWGLILPSQDTRQYIMIPKKDF